VPAGLGDDYLIQLAQNGRADALVTRDQDFDDHGPPIDRLLPVGTGGK